MHTYCAPGVQRLGKSVYTHPSELVKMKWLCADASLYRAATAATDGFLVELTWHSSRLMQAVA